MINIGSKVVCIKNCCELNEITQETGNTPCGCPVKNEIYVIGDIFIGRGNEMCFVLLGKPVYSMTGDKWGWEASHFRELEEYRQAQELEYYRTQPKPDETYIRI